MAVWGKGWRPSFKAPGDWLCLDGRAVIHTWLKSQERDLGWVDHIAFGPCGALGEKRAEMSILKRTLIPAHLEIDTRPSPFAD